VKLLSANDKGELKVWDESMNCIASLAAHPIRIWWLAMKDTNSICAIGGADAKVNIIDLEEMKVVKSLWPNVPCLGLDFSQKDDIVVSGAQDGRIVVTSWKTGEQKFAMQCGMGIWELKYVPHKNGFICSTVTGKLQLHSIEDGRLLNKFVGHAKLVTSVVIDGDLMISSGDDNTVKLWSLASETVIHTLETNGTVFLVDLYENLLVAAVTEKDRAVLRLWDFPRLQLLYDIPLGEPRRVFGLRITGKAIYACTADYIYVVVFAGSSTLPPSVLATPVDIRGSGRDKRCSVQ